MVDPADIRSLTEFQRNAKTHLRQLKKSGRPAVLTVNGRASVIVQDAGAYRKMLRRLELLESAEAVRVGLEQARRGQTRAWPEARAELLDRFASRRPARRRAG